MFKNYVKIAWRNIVKHRVYSAINIFGLSIGIAFTLLITAYVWSGINVNKAIPEENSIYLIQSKAKDGTKDFESYVPIPLATTLKNNYPNLVNNYYRWLWKNTAIACNKKYFRDDVQIADTTFLSIFGFQLIYGTPATAFKEPNSVVITEEKALRFFNTANPIGKVLTIENNRADKLIFIVTGVLKNLPPNSVTATQANEKATNNEIFIPLAALKNWPTQDKLLDWHSAITAYIQLGKGVTPESLIKPIQQTLALHVPADEAKNTVIRFVPLASAYLDANNSTVRKMLYTLSFTALFILLMAVINFVNISIGNSAARLNEIGLRKIFGGAKKQLVTQFLTESITLVFFAVVFSLIIYQLLRPLFSSIIGGSIPSLFSLPLYVVAILLLFVLIVGLMAGIYPATILSSVKVADSVKGMLATVGENILLRKLLIVFQFSTAIIVFIAAIIISKQVDYNINKDLGFDKEQLINIWLPRKWTHNGVEEIKAVRDEIKELPGVLQASVNYTVPGWNSSDQPIFYTKDPDEAVEAFGIISDDKYAATFKIPLLAGNFFSGTGNGNDSPLVVINETLVKGLGFKDAGEAVGKNIIDANNDNSYTISGVVKDFHVESKQTTIKPVAFLNIYKYNSFRMLSVRITPGSTQQTIAAIEKKWTTLLPGEAFDFAFMDDTLQAIYKPELALKNAAYLATILAIIIVLLGTVSIISLSVIKRTKEIGVRKVLGASVTSILALFVRDMVWLIVIATCIACPVAYFIIKLWLNNYVYKIDINAYPFIIVFGCITLITLMLICVQTLKAAIANPVKSL